MPNDVFTKGDDRSSEDTTAAETTAEVNARMALVGEGKKYKSDDDLAVAYVNADKHINTLAQENQQLREQLANSRSMAEALEELKKVTIPSNQSQSEGTPEPLSEDKIADLVQRTVASMNTEGVKRANREEASLKMLQAWGGDDKAQAILVEKAKALGVSRDFLQGVAETSPNAFYQLVGLGGETQQRSETSGTMSDHGVNHGDFQGTRPGGEPTETDWDFWRKMRRDNPRRYNSVAETARRHRLVGEGKLKLPGA